jgi:hypothetical protein
MPTTAVSTATVAVAAGDGLHIGGARVDGLGDQSVNAIAPDGDTWWVLAGRRDLFRVSPDSSQPADATQRADSLHEADSAHRIAGLDQPEGVCVHAHRGTVFVGGDRAGLWRLEGAELLRVESFDDAPTRPDWHTPWGGPPSVFSMASDGDDLYVSVHVGGILHSPDGGETWAPTIDLHEDVHQVIVDPDSHTLWAATGTSGLAQSTDRGRSWTHHTDGLHLTYLLAVASTSAGILVAASSGHSARDDAVYIFDGRRFRRAEGLPDPLGGSVGPKQLAGQGDAAAVLTPDGSLFTSADGGQSWTHADGPYHSPAQVLVTAPAGDQSESK